MATPVAVADRQTAGPLSLLLPPGVVIDDLEPGGHFDRSSASASASAVTASRCEMGRWSHSS
jgi:hypothetical protein